MNVFQGSQSADLSTFRKLLASDTREQNNAENIITQQQAEIAELEQQLKTYNDLNALTPQILKEVSILFTQVKGVTLARGAEAQNDTLQTQVLAIIATEGPLTAKNKSQLSDWLTQRIGQQQVRIILEAED